MATCEPHILTNTRGELRLDIRPRPRRDEAGACTSLSYGCRRRLLLVSSSSPALPAVTTRALRTLSMGRSQFSFVLYRCSTTPLSPAEQQSQASGKWREKQRCENKAETEKKKAEKKTIKTLRAKKKVERKKKIKRPPKQKEQRPPAAPTRKPSSRVQFHQVLEVQIPSIQC